MIVAKAREKVIHIRLDDQELSTIHSLANTYGVKASDLIRLAIEHVNEERPTLGKRFAPGSPDLN
jgi:antitoxin component of RelBE/YafQ-DinJ toxin-antitoxin module